MPDEIWIAPGFFRSGEEVNLGVPEKGESLPEFITAGATILFIVQIVFASIAGIIWWRRRQRIETSADRWLVIANAAASAAALLGFGAGIMLTMINNRMPVISRYFGLAAHYPPVIALAIIAIAFAILTGFMVLLTGVAWQRQYWQLPNRLFFTLLTVAAMAFTGLLAHWDLLTLLL